MMVLKMINRKIMAKSDIYQRDDTKNPDQEGGDRY
jgi:hypothetical protein